MSVGLGLAVLMNAVGPACSQELYTCMPLAEYFPDRYFCLLIAIAASLYVDACLLGDRAFLCLCLLKPGPEYREK